MRVRIILFSLLFLVGCDSPMNNRVRDTKGGGEKSLTSLEFQKSGVQAKVLWVEGPYGSIKKKNQLLVFLNDEKGEPWSLPESKILEFYATMPSMGHPMADAGFFEELDRGVYINRDIRYNMPGDWKNELWILDENYNEEDQLQWLELF